MTVTLISSQPDVPALDDRARREEVAKAARAILRSAAMHTDDDIGFAIENLVDYGNGDVADDALILAARLRVRNRTRLQRPSATWRMDEIALFVAAGFVIVMLCVVGWAGRIRSPWNAPGQAAGGNSQRGIRLSVPPVIMGWLITR